METVNLGLIGGVTVGGGVYQALERNGALIASRTGFCYRVAAVAVRDLSKPRPVSIPKSILTTHWKSVVENPQIRLIVELMGGTTTGRDVVRRALELGKPVVTANKALLSKHGEELFELARRHKANLYYEASVAGGIPIIKVLREGLVGNQITHLYGILNGTCNYILTRMKFEGLDFQEVLTEAQRLGYAEADPALDVDGHDAAHKAGILASLAHGFWIDPDQIAVSGNRAVSKLDIQFAQQLGYTIKLIAKVQRADSGKGSRTKPRVMVRVSPTLVPNTHVLASVNHVFNAVYVRGDVVGDTLYYGRGAGQDATASAVLSDLADAASDMRDGVGNRIPPFVRHDTTVTVMPLSETVSPYYVRLSVIDKPGTLAKIAAILGRSKIGISSVIQPEGHEGESVPLILMIHDARQADMAKALQRIERLAVVKPSAVMIPVEIFDELV